MGTRGWEPEVAASAKVAACRWAENLADVALGCPRRPGAGEDLGGDKKFWRRVIHLYKRLSVAWMADLDFEYDWDSEVDTAQAYMLTASDFLDQQRAAALSDRTTALQNLAGNATLKNKWLIRYDLELRELDRLAQWASARRVGRLVDAESGGHPDTE